MERDRLAELTSEQGECLRLVSRGLATPSIASQLGISPETVDRYIKSALQILGVPGRREAASLLLRAATVQHAPAEAGEAEARRLVRVIEAVTDRAIEHVTSQFDTVPTQLSKVEMETEFVTSQIADALDIAVHRDCLNKTKYLDLKNDLIAYVNLLSSATVHILSRFIDKNSQFSNESIPIRDRLMLLEAYAKRHSGEGVAEYANLLFPELDSLDRSIGGTSLLPKEPPATWRADKLDNETPPDFIRRFYEPWLGKGLDRAHIRNLDRPLYQALDNWLRNHEMPADVDLPTRKEQNSRWVQRIEKEGLAAVLPDGSAEHVLREARRLRSIQQRRKT